MVIFIGAWLIWDTQPIPLVTYAAFTDYWEHTAALTEWLRNFSAPTNPHVASPELSSRFMPYFWVLTWLGLMFDLDAVQLMSISSVLNYLLIIIGLQLFLRYYFSDAWAPFVGFITIFMVWGIGWNWSNLYQLRSFFYIGGYPSTFVFGLSLIAFWATLKMLRQSGSLVVLCVLLGLLTWLMLLGHPLTGAYAVAGCVLLALTSGSALIGQRVIVLAVLVVASGAVELWPYFSTWKLMLGQYGAGAEQWSSLLGMEPVERFKSGEWRHLFYNPNVIVNILGPVLLGIPIIFWLFFKREHSFIVAGAVVMAIPFIANLFIAIPLAHRFLLFVVFYLQLALVWFFLTLLIVCRAEPRPLYGKTALQLMAFAALAVVTANVALLANEYSGSSLLPDNLQVRDKRAVLPNGMNVMQVYQELTTSLDDDAVVLTTAALGWPLPSVKGKVVSLYHENPLVLDQLERYQATGDFFYKSVTDRTRAEIVTRYDASHVLVSDRDTQIQPSVAEWLSRYAIEVHAVGNYRMYDLLDTLPRIEPAIAEQPLEISDMAIERQSDVIDVLPEMLPIENTQDESAHLGMPIAAPIVNVLDSEVSADTGVTAAFTTAEILPEPMSIESFGVPIAAPIINLPEDVPRAVDLGVSGQVSD